MDRTTGLVFLLITGSFSSPCLAQQRMAGKGQYPEARSFSGLSGGGSAIAPDGRPTTNGALALSTPIGFTIKGGHAVLFGGTTSATSSFRWFDGDVATNGSNGSAGVLVGTTLGTTNFAVSIAQTSRLSEDRIVNLQFSPQFDSGRLGVSFGVQDLLDETVTTPNYHESAQSFFVAATYQPATDVFVTAGTGTKRFGKGFANVSAPLARGTRAVVEHDGFAWNYGLELDLFSGKTLDTRGKASLFIGSCQGRYNSWSLAFRF